MKKIITFIIFVLLAGAFWHLLEWAFLDHCFPKTSALNWIIRIILASALGVLLGGIIRRLIAYIKKLKSK